MSVIEEKIKLNRPNLSKSSLKTYISILTNLYKRIWDLNGDDYDIKNFDKVNDILDELKKIEPRKRKTILSALVIITDKKDYRDLMLEDIKEYNKEEGKQEKSDKQKENWIDKKSIDTLLSCYKKQYNAILGKETLTMKDLQTMQNYIILAVLGGAYIPPRRSKDYVDFKIKNIDKNVDNYIDKNNMIFNSYKTAKVYGTQTVKIPDTLKKIIKGWILLNPTDYLFFDSNKNKLSNVKLTQRLNKIFGKNASVNQMRKTYLSDKYSDMIEKQKELKDDFKDMGSSMNQEMIYIKK